MCINLDYIGENCACVCISYWQANMKSGGHPAQNGWVHILWPVCSSHHHHLESYESQCEYIMVTKLPAAFQPQKQHMHHVNRHYLCKLFFPKYSPCQLLNLVCTLQCKNELWLCNLGGWGGFNAVPQAHELGLHHGCGLMVQTGAVPQKWL